MVLRHNCWYIKFGCLSILCLGFILTSAIKAKPQVQVLGLEIPGLHQKDGGGEYDRVINDFINEGLSASLVVYSPARALEKFKHCQHCCVSPANTNEEFYDFDQSVLLTQPIDVAKIYIFSKVGAQPISHLSKLKGKVVGLRFGMIYGKTIDNAEFTRLKVSDLSEHLLLLEHGHIDAFIAYVPDAYHMFEKKGILPLPHDVKNPIVIHSDNLVCKSTVGDFVEQFNHLLIKRNSS